jgi:predicted RNase H-like HicB family nuclease
MMTRMTTSNSAAKAILAKNYVRRLEPDPVQGYTASILEFPGCIAEGDTAEEALTNLDKAASSWLEVSIANGREIRDPIDFEGCSGKIALRIPRSLHQQVAELAELEGCSINQVLNVAISSYVSKKHLVLEVRNLLDQTIDRLEASNFKHGSMWHLFETRSVQRFNTFDSARNLAIFDGKVKTIRSDAPLLIEETVHG